MVDIDLSQFPDWDRNPTHYEGTKEYWEGVFSFEKNRDPELHTAFSELHTKIVNLVIQFCKEHNLSNVDSMTINADGLAASMVFGEWSMFTDSSMGMWSLKQDEYGAMVTDRSRPFLYEI